MPERLIQSLLAEIGVADSSLAAFAQLASWRLDADRSFISLFDTHDEHIVCCASKSSPLISTSKSESSSDIETRPAVSSPVARSRGPSAAAFTHWQILLSKQPPSSLPVILKSSNPDNVSDDFLAAAPVLCAGNQLVGCLLLTGDRQRPDPSASECKFLEDLVITIGGHLNLVRSRIHLNRGKIQARGLDVFYAGGENIHDTLAVGNDPDSVKDEILDPIDLVTSAADSNPLLDFVTTKVSGDDSSVAPEGDAKSVTVVVSDNESASATSIKEAFGRACRLILQVSNVDGVMFFAAESANSKALAKETDENTSLQTADILGYSVPDGGEVFSMQHITVHQLERLMESFPQGQIFTSGPSQSSHHSTSDSDLELADFIPADAKSFAFVPFWESRSKTWRAGCFVWSNDTSRTFDADTDLPFLSSYGHSVLSESARIRADAADSIKSRFIGSITHELRSPLHGIIGGVEFIRAAPLQGFEKHMLDTIESCGNTLLDMIENVLDLSGLAVQAKQNSIDSTHSSEIRNSGTTTPESERHDMVAMIEEVMMSALLAHITLSRASNPEDEGNAAARNTLIRSESSRLLKPRLPQVVIQTEWSKDWVCSLPSGSLRRIVLSLFTNALKFTKSGHILISGREIDNADLRTKGAPGKSEVWLSISDTGQGLSEDFLQHHAGKPFQQEDILTPGTGLGLHLVQKTVRELGGTVELQSRQGQGTVAEVHLPTSCYVDPAERSTTLNARSIRKTVEGMHIVLLGWDMLEDSRDVQGLQLAKQSFADLFQICFGMKVSAEPEAAVEASPDIILCDDMKFEALRAEGSLESIWRKPKAFLVFCSSIRYAAHMSSVYPELSFLTPPPGPNQLSRVLARYFENKTNPEDEGNADNENHRSAAAESAFIKASTNEERFQAVAQKAESTVQPSASDLPLLEDRHTPKAPSLQESRSTVQRLLIVEDNQINMQLLVRFAKTHNIDRATACNGLEALKTYQQAVEESKYFTIVIMGMLSADSRSINDLIKITDISMPVMDGLESTRQIRAWESQHELTPSKIIALTGAVSNTARDDALEAGCDIFMAKPASFEMIKDVLDRYKDTLHLETILVLRTACVALMGLSSLWPLNPNDVKVKL
ncbi:hypothetical protein FH972_023045 [Carpinus fangiana]|uniref:histidine kinase n=1 Tax=Carpinus fangiana TaxID=176857 RepID=A0A5N6KUJ2_9ROSI|nr:hypothetical protein FH972_023045 [Carpinus fangiana]